MTATLKGIENAGLIESIFGRWPSFHDAEIHDIVITRDCDSGAQMDIKVHHWELTSEVDTTGHYVLRHHTLSTMRFIGISDLALIGFNHQNVLWDIEISEVAAPGSGFAVSLPSSFGCEASFKCRQIRVLSATPYENHEAQPCKS